MKDKLKITFEYAMNSSPLSWILSTEQKEQIVQGWSQPGWEAQMKEVRAFLASPPNS
jgi:hypothetical protein